MIFSSSLLLTHLSYRPALFKASKKNLICLLLLKAGKNFSNAANRSMDVMCECCLPRIQSCPRTSGCTVTLSHRQHDASSDTWARLLWGFRSSCVTSIVSATPGVSVFSLWQNTLRFVQHKLPEFTWDLLQRFVHTCFGSSESYSWSPPVAVSLQQLLKAEGSASCSTFRNSRNHK